MIQIVISIAIGLLSAINLVLLVQVLKRLTLMERDEAEDVVQNELRSLREEVSEGCAYKFIGTQQPYERHCEPVNSIWH